MTYVVWVWLITELIQLGLQNPRDEQLLDIQQKAKAKFKVLSALLRKTDSHRPANAGDKAAAGLSF
jgi:hypothetical protein